MQPILEYCDILYDNYSCWMQKTWKHATEARLVLGAKMGKPHNAMYQELGWPFLKDRRNCHKLFKMYTVVNHLAPSYLCDIFDKHRLQGPIQTRAIINKCFQIPLCNKMQFKIYFVNSSMSAWTQLDPKYKSIVSFSSFKKTNYLSLYNK